MRKLWVVSGALLFLSLLNVSAQAQDPGGRVEVFTGYTYGQWNTGDVQSNGQHVSMSGWHVAPALKLNRFLSVTGDFSGYAGSFGVFVQNLGDLHFHDRVTTFSAGPEVGLRLLHLRPFAHVLAGVTRGVTYGTQTDSSGNPVSTSTTHNLFAYAAGGGLDWNLTKHVTFRVVQVDWFRNNFADFDSSTLLAKPGRQNNARVSTGIVWRFGVR